MDHRPTPAVPATLPAPRVWPAWAFTLTALWLLALAAGSAWPQGGMAGALMAQGLAHAQGEAFADTRPLCGMPNAADVLSNLAFLLAGAWGLRVLRGRTALPPATRRAAGVFLVGLLCTGAGSAWYHWAPDATRLMADRAGMAVAMAGLLALAVSERVGPKAAERALAALLPMAGVSAVWPLVDGNVLPWAVVQFGGMLFLAWAALQRPAAGALGLRLGPLLAAYTLAKLLEAGDLSVFVATGGAVSGHSLKHLVAALAAWPVVAALRAPVDRGRGQNAIRPQ